MPRTQRLCHCVALLVCGALLILSAAPALAQAAPVAPVARLVSDLRPGPADGLPEKICFYCCVGVPVYCDGFFLAAGPEFLWLAVDDGTTGTELWRSDGSPAGT